MIKIGFVMEIGLGHTTYYNNLKTAVANDPEIEAHWLPIRFDEPDLLSKIPKIRHDIMLRAGVSAYRKLSHLQKRHGADVLFFHTHMPSVLAHGFMSRIPSAISIDATPKQFLRFGKYYGFDGDADTMLRRRNDAWSKRAFQTSRRIYSWSEWAAEALEREYGVNPANIEVRRTGVNIEQWSPEPKSPSEPNSPSEEVRLLFVGGELNRKGGDLLLRWMREDAPPYVSLDLVTRDAAPSIPRVRVHADLNANDPRLIALYRQADLFVLPTRADCSPLVAVEAIACGLPVVSTRLAGIPETIKDGWSGVLCEPGDYASLSQTLTSIVANPSLRSRMAVNARQDAVERFNGDHNYRDLLSSLKSLAHSPRSAPIDPHRKPDRQ